MASPASFLFAFLAFFSLMMYSCLLCCSADPTDGFTSVPLSQANLVLQWPYNAQLNDRYSFVNGVHKAWLYSTDKSFKPGSSTEPRTEIRIKMPFFSFPHRTIPNVRSLWLQTLVPGRLSSSTSRAGNLHLQLPSHVLAPNGVARSSSSSFRMGTPGLLLILLLLSFTTPPAAADTVVLDDIADRRTVTIQIGDSLLFKSRDLQNLYLFHNGRALDLCNFADASLVYHGKSTQFKWTPPQPGRYYFSIKDEFATSCEKGEKLLVRVLFHELISPALSPEVAPPPTAGGDLPSTPHRGWWAAAPLSLAPEASPLEPGVGSATATPPPEAGEGMPFISSNPVIPLPTGETDTAALRPLLPPSQGAHQVVGQAASLEIGVVLVAIAALTPSAFMFLLWI
ncbi:uncharacterized protein LOC110020069 [Phalaenopsis equestris]|uniref:uncharacterized protein LOC110020069 n=1 Tax=Phalaenopsis equestris TaxID=78828 RepID=UPI0009E559F5|nr:uncharacterized protein LOC110020069 [Phalaenopsis equestris]